MNKLTIILLATALSMAMGVFGGMVFSALLDLQRRNGWNAMWFMLPGAITFSLVVAALLERKT